jgi:hypothetical protein
MAKQISLKSLLGKKSLKEHKLDEKTLQRLKMAVDQVQFEFNVAHQCIEAYKKEDNIKSISRASVAANSIAKRAKELNQLLIAIQNEHIAQEKFSTINKG